MSEFKFCAIGLVDIDPNSDIPVRQQVKLATKISGYNLLRVTLSANQQEERFYVSFPIGQTHTISLACSFKEDQKWWRYHAEKYVPRIPLTALHNLGIYVEIDEEDQPNVR